MMAAPSQVAEQDIHRDSYENERAEVTQKLRDVIQPRLQACYKIWAFIAPLHRDRDEETKRGVLILRKSCIQPLSTQVTRS